MFLSRGNLCLVHPNICALYGQFAMTVVAETFLLYGDKKCSSRNFVIHFHADIESAAENPC